MTQLDFFILDWIQTHLRCGFLDAVMPKITALGEAGIVWIVLAVVLLAIPKTRKLGAAIAVALILDLLLCNILIKPLVHRPRPFHLRPEIKLLIAPPGEFSFPSGHTAASFAAAGALLFSKSRGWIPAMLLALAIGLSRLYLYVHFPTDVLGGILLGLFCGAAGVFCVKTACSSCKKRRN